MGAVDLITGVHEDDEPFTFSAVTWQKWFAWHPVTTVKGKKVWMKTVYRCRKMRITSGDQGMRQVWVYGNIFDVLSK